MIWASERAGLTGAGAAEGTIHLGGLSAGLSAPCRVGALRSRRHGRHTKHGHLPMINRLGRGCLMTGGVGEVCERSDVMRWVGEGLGGG